jgi:hypothetical protein
MTSHIAPWGTSAQGHLTPDENGDLKTDYSRWRLVNEEGRQTWRYLESDEENSAWLQTVADKYHLGLPTVCISIGHFEASFNMFLPRVSQFCQKPRHRFKLLKMVCLSFRICSSMLVIGHASTEVPCS